MEFSKAYRHIGYSYMGIPAPWKPYVQKALIEIEREMWPQWWLPMWAKHLIHYLANGNSVVRVKYWWAYRLRNYLTGGQLITDIKDKYAGLRIYCYGNDAIYKIIDRVTKECDGVCEQCGSTEDVKVVDIHRWYFNLCDKCRAKKEGNDV